MFKKVLIIGVAAVTGLAAVGYAGLIAYTTHSLSKLKFGNPEAEI